MDTIAIRPCAPSDAQTIGKPAYAMECERWQEQAGDLDDMQFTTAARNLLHNDGGLRGAIVAV